MPGRLGRESAEVNQEGLFSLSLHGSQDWRVPAASQRRPAGSRGRRPASQLTLCAIIVINYRVLVPPRPEATGVTGAE